MTEKGQVVEAVCARREGDHIIVEICVDGAWVELVNEVDHGREEGTFSVIKELHAEEST